MSGKNIDDEPECQSDNARCDVRMVKNCQARLNRIISMMKDEDGEISEGQPENDAQPKNPELSSDEDAAAGTKNEADKDAGNLLLDANVSTAATKNVPNPGRTRQKIAIAGAVAVMLLVIIIIIIFICLLACT